jgi:hypothetical protein
MITYPLTIPVATVGMSSITMMGETISSLSQSPFTFAQQIFKHPGERWKASVQLAPMKRQDAETWTSFMLSLKGRSGTFLMGDPNSVQPQGSVVQRNLFQYSEDFSNAYWGKTNCTVVSVGTSNPVSGLPTGVWNLVENADVSLQHLLSKSVSFTAGLNYTAIVYAKLGSGRMLRVDFPSSAFTTNQQNRFNLTAGTGAVVSGTSTISMTSVGGGFYKIMVSNTATVSTTGAISFLLDNGTTGTYNGDGTSYVVIADAHYEVTAANPTYQKTLGAWGPLPLVNGANQVGSSLIIDNLNWSTVGVFDAGDYIQLGSGSTSTLHKVLTNTDSDAAGNATLDIFPAIRTAPANNASITVVNTMGRWRLDTDISQWEINNISSYGMQFNCVEAI